MALDGDLRNLKNLNRIESPLPIGLVFPCSCLNCCSSLRSIIFRFRRSGDDGLLNPDRFPLSIDIPLPPPPSSPGSGGLYDFCSDLRCENGDVVKFRNMLCPRVLRVDSFFGLPYACRGFSAAALAFGSVAAATRRGRNGECLYFRFTSGPAVMWVLLLLVLELNIADGCCSLR